MSNLMVHLIEFSVSLSVIYLVYRLLLYKESFHKLNRAALITIPAFAMLITLLKVDFQSNLSSYYTEIIYPRSETEETAAISPVQNNESLNTQSSKQNSVVIQNETVRQIPYLFMFFLSVSIILVIRTLIQNIKILWIIKTSGIYLSGKLRLVEVNREISPFSYFGYVFLNPGKTSASDLKNILSHEHVHYIQKHSWDNLYLELLALFQWFNPFYWLLRASLKETHEYLADEGALKLGIDRTDYQVVLLNQVAEGPLMAIASNFSKSLTKKRIIMMQKSKKSLQRTITKLFLICPVFILLALIFSCNAQTGQKQEIITAIAPTKMNVLYYGVDNPLAIAVSGVSAGEIVVETDNGKIKGDSGKYIMNPIRTGTARIKVYQVNKDKKVLLQESEFRVKTVPDPTAYVAGKKGGKITREELLKANKVEVIMENFDFDLQFRIIEFVLSTAVPGTSTNREEISKSNTFSKSQIELIKSLVKNQKVYFENIIAIGPDGAKRNLGTVGFEIAE